MYFNCIILCSSSLLFFFPNFACVWCSCFGFSSLCWCARELRKSIELKLYREKQHIYRYTNSHTHHTHILALALPPMHAHTRALAGTQESKKRHMNERKKNCLPSESVARYFRLSLLMAQQVEYISKNEEWKRDTQKEKTRRPIYNNSNSIITATNSRLTTRATNTRIVLKSI